MKHTFEYKNYTFKMRMLTISEAKKMQDVPDWYTKPENVRNRAFNKALGNGWHIGIIKHIFSFLPKLDRPLRVLSLFDGISCGLVALKELNIPVEWYLASEIDKNAIKISTHHFPEIIQLGNVCDINVPDLVEQYGVPDIIIGGSPCKNLSQVGKREGLSTTEGGTIPTLSDYLYLKKQGTEFTGQSYLFWEYMRIYTELKETFNKDILFLLENVRMSKYWEIVFSNAIGITGNHIDTRLISPQSRHRIYWTNINGGNIPQPQEMNLSNECILNVPFNPDIDTYEYMTDVQMSKIIPYTPEDKFEDIAQRILQDGKAICYPSTRAGIKITRFKEDKSMALISTCNDGIGKFEDKPRIIEIEQP